MHVAGGEWEQSSLMATGETARGGDSVAFARGSAWIYAGRVSGPS